MVLLSPVRRNRVSVLVAKRVSTGSLDDLPMSCNHELADDTMKG